MKNSIKNIIDNRFESVKISSVLEENILNSQIGEVKIKRKFRRSAVAFAAVFMFMVLSVSVFAMTPGFQTLIGRISKEISPILTPIGAVSESNGIRMEVVGGAYDGNTALIYLTLQDLTGDRVGSSYLNLRDHDFSFGGISSGVFHDIKVVDYDKKTKTATLQMMTVGIESAEKISNGKMKLEVDGFFEQQQTLDRMKPALSCKGITTTPETVKYDEGKKGEGYVVRAYQFDGITVSAEAVVRILESLGAEFEVAERRIYDVLLPEQNKIENDSLEFAYISAIGFIDGNLHIQTYFPRKNENAANYDDGGSYYMTSEPYPYISITPHEIAPLSAWVEYNGKTYLETVFFTENINEEELSKMKIVGEYFSSGKNYVEGDWELGFELEPLDTIKKNKEIVEIDGAKILEVSASAIGVKIKYDTTNLKDNTSLYSVHSWIRFNVATHNGVRLDSAMTNRSIGSDVVANKITAQEVQSAKGSIYEVTYYYSSYEGLRLFDIESMNFIKINGVEIPIE